MQIRAQLLWLGAGSPSFVQVSGKAMCVESLSRELSEKWCECERGSGAPELFQGSALLLRTGSGKTLAFALPYLSMSRSRKGGRKLDLQAKESCLAGLESWTSSSSPALCHASWLWHQQGDTCASRAMAAAENCLVRELAMQIAEVSF